MTCRKMRALSKRLSDMYHPARVVVYQAQLRVDRPITSGYVSIVFAFRKRNVQFTRTSVSKINLLHTSYQFPLPVG